MASSVKIEARQAFAYTYPGRVYPGCEFVRYFSPSWDAISPPQKKD